MQSVSHPPHGARLSKDVNTNSILDLKNGPLKSEEHTTQCTNNSMITSLLTVLCLLLTSCYQVGCYIEVKWTELVIWTSNLWSKF